jgi:hypothetical protein
MAAEEPAVKGSWIACTVMEKDLQNLEKEGFCNIPGFSSKLRV